MLRPDRACVKSQFCATGLFFSCDVFVRTYQVASLPCLHFEKSTVVIIT